MEGADGSPQSDPTEDVPHARGPPVVGVEDMGLQDGRGVEMTLSQDAGGENNVQSAVPGDDDASQGGGGGDSSSNQQEGKSSKDAEAKTDTEPGAKDGDGDIELGDQTTDSAAATTTAAAVGEGKESGKGEEETKG